MTTDNRFALDAVAVVQQLGREEGCRFAGIEQDPQHAETARLRTQHVLSRR